jgi:glycosyltransferase involved in cell wall biosynthesis
MEATAKGRQGYEGHVTHVKRSCQTQDRLATIRLAPFSGLYSDARVCAPAELSRTVTAASSGPTTKQYHRATLCILCFNQERYIGQALEAALSQTGDPIEIIVSDDGSSDSSLQVAQKISAGYKGPHRIIVRQTARNLGTLHHLFDVAELATGDLLVVGAADDLSLPDRVATLVDIWRCEGASALFSGYQIIDDAGTVVEDFHRFDDRWLPIHDYLPGRTVVSVHGASSAYDRKALIALPRPTTRILFEDTWLTLMLTLTDDRIRYVDQALVAYRRHTESITNFGQRAGDTRANIEAADEKERQGAAAYRDVVRTFRDHAIAANLSERVALGIVNRDLRFFEAQAAWPRLNWQARLTAATCARQPWMRRWALLRLMSPIVRVAIVKGRQMARRSTM